MKKIVVSCFLCALPLGLWAAESEQAQVKNEYDERCEQARAAKLRPLQQQKIEECLAEPPAYRAEKMTREQCEKYWGDYGWGAVRAGGTRNPSLFNDIPECRVAETLRQSEAR